MWIVFDPYKHPLLKSCRHEINTQNKVLGQITLTSSEIYFIYVHQICSDFLVSSFHNQKAKQACCIHDGTCSGIKLGL